MKIKRIDFLIQKGEFSHSPEFENILNEVKSAVKAVVWPEGSDVFTIYPEKRANGVVPKRNLFKTARISPRWEINSPIIISCARENRSGFPGILHPG